MLLLYKWLTLLSTPLLPLFLKRRLAQGKEDATRLQERYGKTNKNRPDGQLIWLHAASVGEAQSALILINQLMAENSNMSFVVTTGTVTSATLMAKRLPAQTTHQYAPLDHPTYIECFLNHWSPDAALWMESELWPNMLMTIQQRQIPAALVNARLSDRSYSRWKLLKRTAQKILSAFDVILTQTETDKNRYTELGANNVTVTDNLKYSATALPYDQDDLRALQNTLQKRPIWLYASTHAGEETLACRLHTKLQKDFPDLLTILVPRHPERRDHIFDDCDDGVLRFSFRGESKALPTDATNIYVADTLGELGLFYHLSSIAIIGRSFSDDGGGGHNPIEAAQLNCAVLTGPNVQYQTQLFNEMLQANAAKQLHNEEELLKTLTFLLKDKAEQEKMQKAAKTYASNKEDIINNVMTHIQPLLKNKTKKKAA